MQDEQEMQEAMTLSEAVSPGVTKSSTEASAPDPKPRNDVLEEEHDICGEPHERGSAGNRNEIVTKLEGKPVSEELQFQTARDAFKAVYAQLRPAHTQLIDAAYQFWKATPKNGEQMSKNKQTAADRTTASEQIDTATAPQHPANASTVLAAVVTAAAIAEQRISAAPTTVLATPETELAKTFASFQEVNQAAKRFGYNKLDSAGTKHEYDSLNAELEQHCETIAKARITLEEGTPYLARMQALTSQRGSERKKVLREAGVPTWTVWAQAYAEKLHYTVRTIQSRIKQLRGDNQGKSGCGTGAKASSLRASDRLALVKAAHNFNELVMAYQAGLPIESFIASGKKIMNAKRLDDILQGQGNTTPEHDYKALLIKLLEVIEEHRERCPIGVAQAGRDITDAIRAKTSTTRPRPGRKALNWPEDTDFAKPSNAGQQKLAKAIPLKKLVDPSKDTPTAAPGWAATPTQAVPAKGATKRYRLTQHTIGSFTWLVIMGGSRVYDSYALDELPEARTMLDQLNATAVAEGTAADAFQPKKPIATVAQLNASSIGTDLRCAN